MELAQEKKHLLRVMRQMQKFLMQKSMCDLTIHIENATFPLHKNIFAAASPLIHYLILQAVENFSGGKLELSIQRITAIGFRAFVRYIYTGKTPKEDSKDWEDFVKTCQDLSVSYPVKKNKKIVLHQPTEDIEVALLPRNKDGAIEVVLRKSTEPREDNESISDDVPVDILDHSVSDAEPEDVLLQELEQQHTKVDFDSEEVEPSSQASAQRQKPSDDPVVAPPMDHEYASPIKGQNFNVIKMECRHCGGVLVPVSKTPIRNAYSKSIQCRCTTCKKPAMRMIDPGPRETLAASTTQQKRKRVGSPSPAELEPGQTSPPLSNLTDNEQDAAVASITTPKSTKHEIKPPKMKKTTFLSDDGSFRPYFCDQCGGRYTRKHSLKLHKETHCGVSKHAVRCSECQQVYSCKSSLRSHARSVHPGKMITMTPLDVPWTRVKKKDLRDIKEGWLQCRFCEAPYMREHKLQNHERICGPAHKFRCDFCPRGFKNRRDWDKHLWQSHQVQVTVADEDEQLEETIIIQQE